MRTGIFFALMLGLLSLVSVAQQLPACIEKLNRKTDLTTTKFERVITLHGNRNVYKFTITSKRECIHCDRGTIFYDGNCNMIAYFTTSRGFKGFVEEGYTARELGYPGYPRITYGSKKPAVATCVLRAINNPDSLKKAGVHKIVQVRIKDKILYGFEHVTDPKLANCKDCSKSIVYYNEDCKPEVTFSIGGITGVKGDNGYTASDFINKTTLKIVWNANDAKDGDLSKNMENPEAFNLPKYYTVGKNWFSDFDLFKLGDKLSISSRDGLKHFRNGKILNTYKIIPQQVTEHQIDKSKPNVKVSKQQLIYYLEPFSRYFRIADNGFMVTKSQYQKRHNFKHFTKADWTVAFNIE